MSLLQMRFAGAVMIVVITGIRRATLNWLPKKTFLALWGIALIRLLIPFSLPSMFSVYTLFEKSRPVTTATYNTVDVLSPSVPVEQVTETVEAISEAANSISPWAVIWAVGALICALFFGFAYWKCLREFQTSLPVENNFSKRWLAAHPIKRHISIRESDRISAPLTFGIFRPVILMPKKTDWNDEAGLQYILEHEFIHICRFDTVTKLLLTAALCVHWFNPLVWVMYELANRDLELSCDEAVVHKFGESRRANYANTLIRMEETKSGLRPLCNSFSKNAIEERIMAIMKIKKTSAAMFVTAIALVVAVGMVFATSADAEGGKVETTIAEVEILSTSDKNGNVLYSTDGGITYLNEDEFRGQFPALDVEWWTYDEYKAWLEEEKVQLQSMIGETAWTGGRGAFVWTQGLVYETIAQYEKTLEDIKNGLQVSKTVNGSEDVMISSYAQDSVTETAEGAAIIFDNRKTVTSSPYDTPVVLWEH